MPLLSRTNQPTNHNHLICLLTFASLSSAPTLLVHSIRSIVIHCLPHTEIYDDFGQDRLRNQGKGGIYENGERAFHEYWPLPDGPPCDPSRIYRSTNWGRHVELFILDTRSYRSVHEPHEEPKPSTSTDVGGDSSQKEDNNNNTTTTTKQKPPAMKQLLGQTQLTWLLEGLQASTATWKFIATSVPLSYTTGWPRPEETGYDGWSDGVWDSIGGPEKELECIFQHIRDCDILNVIFLSGDVHFPFCISYDPFHAGKPLVYEIGCTPFHALCLPPPERGADNTFCPTVLYSDGTFAGDFCNFGHVKIEGESGNFTFEIRDVRGKIMYELTLEPGK
jgi:alkaline phosphatase D